MKKKLISKILTISLISMILFTTPVFATDTNGLVVKIILDNKEVTFTQDTGFPLINEDGRTLVQFRQAMEAFGCTVEWNQQDKIAIATKGDITVKIPIGQAYVFKNDEKVDNDTEAVVLNGKTYLPIRVVLQSFCADVDWDNSNKAVVAKSLIPIKEEVNNAPTSILNNEDDTPIVSPTYEPPVDTTPNISNLNINMSNYEEFLSHFDIKQWDEPYDNKTTKIVVQLRFKDSNDKQVLQQFFQSMNYVTLQSHTVQIIKDKCMNYDKIGIAYMTQNDDIVFNAVEITNQNNTLIYSPITWGKSWE